MYQNNQLDTLTIPESAEVSGVSAAQIRRWISERHKRVHNSEGCVVLGASDKDYFAKGTGEDTLLSRHTVLQIAVAGVLVKQGVSVFEALKAARRFSHSGGEGSGGWVGEPVSMGRNVGEPFAEGETWLLVAGNNSQVANICSDESRSGAYPNLSAAISVFRNSLCDQDYEFGHESAPVVTLNMDFIPEIVSRRIEGVIRGIRYHKRRYRNTRLREKHMQS